MKMVLGETSYQRPLGWLVWMAHSEREYQMALEF